MCNLYDLNLIPTQAHSPYSYPFEYFNPVQSEVFLRKDGSNNMIVAANTSAGKTIAAELLMDDTLARCQRVIYLSPLKSLTEEKYGDWKKRFSRYRLAIMTSDYVLTEKRAEMLPQSDIIVMTSEMMDSRTRKFEAERNFWMCQVGLVVVDEAHILSTGRGDAVETGLMRFTRYCPQARILLLSATMSNAGELAGWLTLLNGHQTDVVESNWRPVELQMHYVAYTDICNKFGKFDYWRTEFLKISLALRLIREKAKEKFLVFVHSKNTGQFLKRCLEKEHIPCAFHNADLTLPARRKFEDAFKDRRNGPRVLISTSTTAWGVNLPARNVIILGVNRGLNNVDELDLIQMAGRAGRYGIDDEGHVFLIVPGSREGDLRRAFARPRPVTSVLTDRWRLGFHILAEIENQSVKTIEDIFTWYRRSLAYRQGAASFSDKDAEIVLADLLRMKMVNLNDDGFLVTSLGRVSAGMYYHPYDIYAWYQNFYCLYTKKQIDDPRAVAWAIADIPSNRQDYLPKDLKYLRERWNVVFCSLGKQVSPSTVLWTEAVFNCLVDEPGEEVMVVSKMRTFLNDAARNLTALRIIDRTCAFWHFDACWKNIEEQLAARAP